MQRSCQFNLTVNCANCTIFGRYSDLRSRHDELCLAAPRGVGITHEFSAKTSWLNRTTFQFNNTIYTLGPHRIEVPLFVLLGPYKLVSCICCAHQFEAE